MLADTVNVEEAAATHELRLLVQSRIARAQRRGRFGKVAADVIRRRLATVAPETLSEIASRWDLSRERIRQIEVEVKEELRRLLRDLN